MIHRNEGRIALNIFWYYSGGIALKQQHECFRNRNTRRAEYRRTDVGCMCWGMSARVC